MIIIEKLLTPNKYSRPGTKLKSIKGIAMHWVANPKSSAMANRNYFENHKLGKTGYSSAHYIIDMSGEIIRCIPDDEMAYHVGSQMYTDYAKKKFGSYPNNCTLGIEMCHPDWTGQFTEETWNAAIELCQYLCKKYNLNPKEDITTHHLIVGWKNCPKWFTDYPAEFEKFKKQIILTYKDYLYG